MSFTEIAAGLGFPEGPIALPDGSVLVVEIQAGQVTRVTPDGRLQVVARTGGGPNGAAMGPDGKVYVCNNGGFDWARDPLHGLRPNGQAKDYSGGRIERVDIETGRVEVLYDRGPNGPLRGPNDLVFDRHGGFWFTDIGKNRHRDMDRGGVYYAKADGSEIREAIYPMMQPNGVALSPTEDRLYVAETITGRLWSFDLTGPGEIAPLPYPSPNGGTLLAASPGFQMFDSMAVDADGRICVATLMNGGITVVSPDGAAVEHIALPDLFTSNICFGGADLSTAYVTLSATGRLVSLPWRGPGLRLNFQ